MTSPLSDMPTPLNIEQFPLHGSRLIEASAGTGKTFTIALLYVRLVLGHGDNGAAFSRPITPPECLVVTFTEAATEELKDRIRQRLVEAADCFLADPATADTASDDPLIQLRNSIPGAEWSHCARRLQIAAEWMDEAAVSTIHSWCYRMLREHAFDTGNLFQQTLVTDQSELITEIVQDYWRRHCYGLTPEQAEVVLTHMRSPEQLQKTLRNWLAQPDSPLLYRGQPLTPPESLHRVIDLEADWRRTQRQLEDDARAQWQADISGVIAELERMRPHLYKKPYQPDEDGAWQANLEALTLWARGGGRPAGIDKYADDRFKLKKSARDDVPSHPAFTALARLFDHESQPPVATDSAGSSVAIVALLQAHARQWVQTELDQRLRERAELGFNDMLRALDQALQSPQGPQLAAAIRRQFPVAMVDEFQDTDPLQYRILDAVYRVSDPEPDTALVMIGDPKQAIYSFRGADIHTYLAAREATQGRHYTLSRNFRSTAAMVQATNALFTHAEQQPNGAFRYADPHTGDNPLPFVPVQAQGRKEQLLIDGQPADALNLWLQPAEVIETSKGPKECLPQATYQAAMADSTASQIVAWLENPQTGFHDHRTDSFTRLQPRDIAILVRSRNEAERIRQALSARRLPSVYLSDRDSVFATPEARDVRFWLTACANPAQERHIRSALATRTLSWTLPDLDRLNRDELAWEAQVSRFREYRRLWHSQGVLPMLHRLIHDQRLPQRLLAEPDGERCLTNVLHLAEWLQQTSATVDGEQSLMRRLDEQIDHPQEEQILRLESDADLIKVITIHKSKGLEYPLVLLPFASLWRQIDAKQTALPARHQDRMAIEIGADKSDYPDPFTDAHEAQLAEDIRLLYVAVTRARHAVWLTTGLLVKGNSHQSGVHNSALGAVLNAGATDQPQGFSNQQELALAIARVPELTTSAPPPSSAQAWEPPAAPKLTPARTVTRTRLTPWWIASYSALQADTGSMLEPESPEASTQQEELDALDGDANSALATPTPGGPPGDGMHRFPRGPGPGTFLHGLLEWAAAHETETEQGFAAALSDSTGRQQLLQRRCTVREWQDWVGTLDDWLVDLLDRPLALSTRADQAVRLADLTQWQSEMEFLFPTHHVPVARLDRLVCQYTLDQRPRPALRAQSINGLLKGFIDLVFEHEGRYYVADWKSNRLGANDLAYSPEAMADAILAKRYDLQYVLYVLALHRLLQQRLPDYDYDTHVGGAVFVFLRGHHAQSQGLFHDRPPKALIQALDRLFQNIDARAEGHH